MVELEVAESLGDFQENIWIVNLDCSCKEGTRWVSPNHGLVLEVVACLFLNELGDLSRGDLMRGQVVQKKDVLLRGKLLVHFLLKANRLIVIILAVR